MSDTRSIPLDDHDELQNSPVPGVDVTPSIKNGSAASATTGNSAVRTVTADGNASIDGVLEGTAWTAPTISFSVPDMATAYAAGYSEAATNFRGVSAAQHAVADYALTGVSAAPGYAGTRFGSVASFTNEAFTDVGTGPATIMLGSSSVPPTSYAYFPAATGKSGDVWFGQAYDNAAADLRTPAIGNYAWFTVMHELGHSLGLKHGNQAGGVADETLPAATDDSEYSIMTYASYVGAPATSDTCAVDSNPQTYMMDDIAALQDLYGANFTVLGPTRYSWDPNTGETFLNGVGQGRPGQAGDAQADRNKVFETIWNGDGREASYDLSNYRTGVQIDLNPGEHCITSAAQLAQLGPGQQATGNVYNALQYQNDPRSLIANATGGSGDDAIAGNAADNVLEGGAGDNTIDGGGGYDTAQYEVARQQAVITEASGGTLTVTFQGGQDSLANIEALKFSNETLATAKLDWLNYTGTTTGISGMIAMDDPGQGSPNYLQAQYINAGASNLAVSTAASNVFIRTGNGDDALQVYSGQNVLDGGLGSNFLVGGSGTDTFFTDARTPGAVWNTIGNFHPGDAATLWGFDGKVSSYSWDSGVAGAAGFQGATLRADIAGGAGRTGNGVDASITFAGLSVQQAKSLEVTTGTQPGGSYLYLFDPGA